MHVHRGTQNMCPWRLPAWNTAISRSLSSELRSRQITPPGGHDLTRATAISATEKQPAWPEKHGHDRSRDCDVAVTCCVMITTSNNIHRSERR